MMIKGAIFDIDGTLLDSMGMWDDYGSMFLRSVGREPGTGLNEILKNLSFDEALLYLNEEYGIRMTFHEFMEKVNTIVRNYYSSQVKVKEGVYQFLNELKQKNIHMAIATLTDIELVETALRYCGIYDYFDSIVTCRMVNAGKEHPDVYRKALENIATEKSETIVFEDVYTAIRTAGMDGFRTVAVYDIHADNSSEIKKEADYFINDFKEMTDFWKWVEK